MFGSILFNIKNGNCKNIKEYNYNGILIFEGEYINGERNGKGKEYNYNGILIFEGEYLNGERNGKGKEYYNNGLLRFEGEYLKGKKWNGKGYNLFGSIIFQIKNGNCKNINYSKFIKFLIHYLIIYFFYQSLSI